MLALEFFSWWYGRGWKQVASSLESRLVGVLNSFSVIQLLKTLFAPWRRIITYPGASIGERFKAWGDNAFSRVVGFIVRTFVLLAAFLILIVTAALSLVELIIWPLLPPAIPILLVMGLLG